MAELKERRSGSYISKPTQSGLFISIYKADYAGPGYPGYDLIYFIGFVTTAAQLGFAAVP